MRVLCVEDSINVGLGTVGVAATEVHGNGSASLMS